MQMNPRIQMSVKLTGLDAVRQKLGSMRAMKAVPDILGKSVVAGIRRTFDQSEDPNTGRKWAKLKSRAGSPLMDTKRLRRSIHYIARRSGVTVGTNFAYAHVHQWGMTIRPRRKKFLVFEVFGMKVFAKQVTIPQRRFLPTTDAGISRVTEGTLEKQVAAFFSKIAGESVTK